LVAPGDLVILLAYGTMDETESRHYRPRVVFVDADNRIVHQGSALDVAGRGDPAVGAPECCLP
jgi:aspartate 1-decarboxylase